MRSAVFFASCLLAIACTRSPQADAGLIRPVVPEELLRCQACDGGLNRTTDLQDLGDLVAGRGSIHGSGHQLIQDDECYFCSRGVRCFRSQSEPRWIALRDQLGFEVYRFDRQWQRIGRVAPRQPLSKLRELPPRDLAVWLDMGTNEPTDPDFHGCQ